MPERKLKIIKNGVLALLILLFIGTFYLIMNNSFASRYKSSTATLPIQSIQPVSSAQVTPTLPTKLSLLFVGDMMMARNIGGEIENGQDPFVNVESTFKKYDFVVGNLETNISTPGISFPARNKPYVFNSPLKALDALTNAGVKIVSLANNHTMDYYAAGLIDEMKLLDEKNIINFGAGKNIADAYQPKYIIFKDTVVAFVGFNDIENWQTNPSDISAGSAYFNDVRMEGEIKDARSKADIVVVVPHWGIEYSLAHDSRQETYAKLFIEWGADIVIGSHPHVIQDISEYNGKKIYYSMGNFLFDGMYYIPNASDAIMVEVNIENRQIVNSDTINVTLDSKGWPQLK